MLFIVEIIMFKMFKTLKLSYLFLILSTAWKPLLHTLKEKRDKHTTHNNPTATWHTSFIPPHHSDLPTLNRPPLVALLPHWSGQPQLTTLAGYILHLAFSHTSLSLKMEPIQGSEMSANYNLTPGKYPKEHFQWKTLVYKWNYVYNICISIANTVHWLFLYH